MYDFYHILIVKGVEKAHPVTRAQDLHGGVWGKDAGRTQRMGL
jgi:hypothetical protein